ncbi:MAG: hypothetical protein ABMA64_38000 [Myxococcota bacterium]
MSAFHARERARDLDEVRRRLAAVGWTPDDDPEARRRELEGVAALVAHVIEAHASPPAVVPPGPPRPDPSTLDDALSAGAAATRRAARALDPAPEAGAALVPLAHAVADALAAAVVAHHRLDPFAEMDEEDAERSAVPDQVTARADARALVQCPTCGSPLGRDDRTATGTYCEVCRTRWIEPG